MICFIKLIFFLFMETQYIGSQFLCSTGVTEANPLKANKITCLYFSASMINNSKKKRLVPALSSFYSIIS